MQAHGTDRPASALPHPGSLIQAAAEHASDLIVVVRNGGRLDFANRAWRQATGFEEGELAGLSLNDWLAPESIPAFALPQSPSASAQGVTVAFLRKDGGPLPLRGSLVSLGADGSHAGVCGVFRAPDPASFPQPDLHDSAAIPPPVENAVVLADAAGCVVWANSAFAELSGYSIAEVLGRKPGHFLQGPETDPATVQRMRDCLRRQVGFSAEVLNYRKDGGSYRVHLEIQPVFDARGTLTNFLALERDVTPQANLAPGARLDAGDGTPALQQTRTPFEVLFESAPDAMVLTDQRGVIKLVNCEAERVFGWSREELIGQSVELLVPVRSRGRHGGLRDGFVESHHGANGARRPSLSGLRKDGVIFPADISLSPIQTPEGRMIVAAVRDTTVRRRLEVQVESERAVLEALARDEPLAKVLELLVAGYEALFPGMHASVLLLDADGLRLRHGAAPNLPAAYCGAIEGLPIGPGVGSCGTAASSRTIVIAADIATDPLWRDFRDLAVGHGLRACWSVPILGNSDRVLGTFAFYFGAPRSPLPEELSIFQKGAHLASLAITRRNMEEKVRRSEAMLAEGQALGLMGSWEMEVGSRSGYWSEQMFRFFGLGPAERAPDLEVMVSRIHPEDRAAFREYLESMVRGEMPPAGEHRTDPEVLPLRYFHPTVRVIRDESGRAVKFQGVVQDVTERRRTQQDLEASKARLQRILEATPIPLCYVERDGAATFRNERFVKILGYTAEDVPTLTEWWPTAYPDPEYRRLVMAEWREAVAAARAAGGDIRPRTCNIVCKGGDMRVFEVSGIALDDGFIATFVDLTARVRAEEELQKFRTISERAAYGVVIASVDGVLEYVNDAWARMHGWPREELAGKRLSVFHSDEDMPRVESLRARLLREGTYTSEEVGHVRRDGGRFPSLMSGTLIRDRAGAPMFMTATSLDITDQVQSRRRLNLQNEVLKAIARGVGLGEVLDLLCRQMELIYERVVCAVMELTPAGTLKVVAGPSMQKRVRDSLDGLRPGAASGSCGTAAYMRRPVFVADTSTDPRWAAFREFAADSGIRACWSVPIFDGETLFGTFSISHGAPASPSPNQSRMLEECAQLAAIAVQRHRALKALAESETHFRTLADSGQALIWTSGLDGKCDYFNKVWTDFTGRGLSQELGDGWLGAVHPQDRQPCLDRYLAAFGQRQTFTMVFRLRRRDGEFRSVEDHGTPRYNSAGEFVGYIGHCLDITDRLLAEKKLSRSQRLEAIGQLAGGIAHDLNNALAPILMTSALLRMNHPDSGELIQTLESSTQRCADMVKQLLTFAKGAEGQRVVLNPLDLIQEIQKIVRAVFPKNIEQRISAPGGLWPLLGDATQLHQVLLNLCVNARDAMPHGGVLSIKGENVLVDSTFLATAPEARPGRYVLLDVSDTGVGMSPEVLDRLFEPFFTTKGPEVGTGLGLSSAAGIVKGHGGFIRVYSSPGAGARFSIYLPASEAGPPCDAGTGNPGSAAITGAGETILIVDDELNIREAMRGVLCSLGFTVVLANDGAEAVIVAAENRESLRLVITDVHMPHMGGVQLLRTLRRMLPGIRAIVASGRLEEQDESDLRKLGASAFLAKPFTKTDLVEALREALIRPAAGAVPPPG